MQQQQQQNQAWSPFGNGPIFIQAPPPQQQQQQPIFIYQQQPQQQHQQQPPQPQHHTVSGPPPSFAQPQQQVWHLAQPQPQQQQQQQPMHILRPEHHMQQQQPQRHSAASSQATPMPLPTIVTIGNEQYYLTSPGSSVTSMPASQHQTAAASSATGTTTPQHHVAGGISSANPSLEPSGNDFHFASIPPVVIANGQQQQVSAPAALRVVENGGQQNAPHFTQAPTQAPPPQYVRYMPAGNAPMGQPILVQHVLSQPATSPQHVYITNSPGGMAPLPPPPPPLLPMHHAPHQAHHHNHHHQQQQRQPPSRGFPTSPPPQHSAGGSGKSSPQGHHSPPPAPVIPAEVFDMTPLTDEDVASGRALIEDLRRDRTDRVVSARLTTMAPAQINRIRAALEADGELVYNLCEQERGNIVCTILQRCGADRCPRQIAVISKNFLRLSLSQRGCIALPRILGFLPPQHIDQLFAQIHENISRLVCDRYANYVCKHFANCNRDDLIEQMASALSELPDLVTRIAVDKFGSYVIDELLKRGTYTALRKLLDRLFFGNENDLRVLCADQYGNYIVQTAFDNLYRSNVDTRRHVAATMQVLAHSPFAINITKHAHPR